MEVIGTPIPACESFPISRGQQRQNMAEFLGGIATAANLPENHAVCVTGEEVVQANKKAANVVRSGMKLLTKEISRKLPPLYSQEDKGSKAVAHVKFFTPDAGWTWYATEFDGQDTFFGLVDGQDKELGYFSLSELSSVHGPMGLPIERDLHWRPRTLEEIAPEMFQDGRSGGEQ
jgi:hypothetical protein